MLHLSKQEFRGNLEYCLGLKHDFKDNDINSWIEFKHPDLMDAEIFSHDNCLWRVLIVEDKEDPKVIADYWDNDYFQQLFGVLTQFTINTKCKEGVFPKGRA